MSEPEYIKDRKREFSDKRKDSIIDIRKDLSDFHCSADERVYANLSGPRVSIYFLNIIVFLGGFGIWLSIFKRYELFSITETIITYALAILSSATVDAITTLRKQAELGANHILLDQSSKDVQPEKPQTLSKIDMSVVYLIITLFVFLVIAAYIVQSQVEWLALVLSINALLLAWYLWLYASAENYGGIPASRSSFAPLGDSVGGPLLTGSGKGLGIQR